LGTAAANRHRATIALRQSVKLPATALLFLVKRVSINARRLSRITAAYDTELFLGANWSASAQNGLIGK
jgi:hypothetical protein